MTASAFTLEPNDRDLRSRPASASPPIRRTRSTKEDLIRQADAAMYRVKSTTKNAVGVATVEDAQRRAPADALIMSADDELSSITGRRSPRRRFPISSARWCAAARPASSRSRPSAATTRSTSARGKIIFAASSRSRHGARRDAAAQRRDRTCSSTTTPWRSSSCRGASARCSCELGYLKPDELMRAVERQASAIVLNAMAYRTGSYTVEFTDRVPERDHHAAAAARSG